MKGLYFLHNAGSAYIAATVIGCLVFYNHKSLAEPLEALGQIQTAQAAPAENTTPKRDMRDSSNQQKDGPKGEPKEPQQGQSGSGQRGSTPGPK